MGKDGHYPLPSPTQQCAVGNHSPCIRAKPHNGNAGITMPRDNRQQRLADGESNKKKSFICQNNKI